MPDRHFKSICSRRTIRNMILRQKIWLAVVGATNTVLWLVPGDVVEQIARDRHTMLGRYSRTHFAWIVAVAVLSVISVYIDQATGERYKRRCFKILAMMLMLVPTLGLADLALRLARPVVYVRDDDVYRRLGGAESRTEFIDKPQASRTYPDAPSGFGSVRCVMRIDERGYRNARALDQCDILVLGDSFAEGSSVSDEHVWVRRLAERTGASVYNLGMSGYAPFHYHQSLERFGVAMKPKLVLCLLYEGNDFRARRREPEWWSRINGRIKAYLKESPVLNAVDTFMIQAAGRLNDDGKVVGAEILDWLPLTIPIGESARRYAFAPKQLRDLYETPDDFASGERWGVAAEHLLAMHGLCERIGARMAVVYAPTKAHVTLRIAGTRLPADKVRAFTKISYKKALPDPPEFMRSLLDRLDARERIVGDWCREAGLRFLSLTPALVNATGDGVQTYYTYDQHWTPDGHEVVTRRLAAWLHENPADARGHPGAPTGTGSDHLTLRHGPTP